GFRFAADHFVPKAIVDLERRDRDHPIMRRVAALHGPLFVGVRAVMTIQKAERLRLSAENLGFDGDGPSFGHAAVAAFRLDDVNLSGNRGTERLEYSAQSGPKKHERDREQEEDKSYHPQRQRSPVADGFLQVG